MEIPIFALIQGFPDISTAQKNKGRQQKMLPNKISWESKGPDPPNATFTPKK